MELPGEYFPAILWTLATLVGGWLVGWLVEVYFLRRVSKAELLHESLSGLGRWMGLAAGLGLALRYRLLPPDWQDDSAMIWKISSMLICTIFLARLVGRYVHHHTIHLSGEFPATTLVRNVVSVLVYIVGTLIILQTLGISVAPVLTALGVGGLAVALALQDTLGNLFAGIQIIATRKIQVGQFISLENALDGYVTDITWRYTTIRKLNDQMVIIPNSKLASSIVINSYLPDQEVNVNIELGVHYDSDLEEVERLAIDIAKSILKDYPGAVLEFEPLVRFRGFGDSAINMAVIYRVKEWTDQFLLKHDMIKALHKGFREKGIVIPFPIRTLDLPKNALDALSGRRSDTDR